MINYKKTDYFEETDKRFEHETSWLEDSDDKQGRFEILMLMLIAELKEINDSILSIEETIRIYK